MIADGGVGIADELWHRGAAEYDRQRRVLSLTVQKLHPDGDVTRRDTYRRRIHNVRNTHRKLSHDVLQLV